MSSQEAIRCGTARTPTIGSGSCRLLNLTRPHPELGSDSRFVSRQLLPNVRLTRSGSTKLPFRYREEFRTPLGVRKSARTEPAVCGPRLMGI